MKETIMAALMLMGTGVRAAMPANEKARLLELRTANREDKARIKQAAVDQHKGLALIREREKSDVVYVKSSAAKPETIHESLLEVREKSRRDRLALRGLRRADATRFHQAIKARRMEISALRRKKK